MIETAIPENVVRQSWRATTKFSEISLQSLAKFQRKLLRAEFLPLSISYSLPVNKSSLDVPPSPFPAQCSI